MTIFVLWALLAAGGPALAEPGSIDWQRRVVRCAGTGAPRLGDAAGNVAVARVGAQRAAKQHAVRSCLEVLKGVSVKTGATVGAAMAGDASLAAEVRGAVKRFKVVGTPRYFSDGGVEMDVEVPLDGKLSELLLPVAPAPAEPPPAAAPGGETGLVVDAKGAAVTPALAPRILDDAGREIYGPSVLAADARRGGGAAYARDLESARRALAARLGSAPRVVKAVGATGADVIVSGADAAALRGQPYLAQGRVVILTDRTEPP
jgi:hypothetical protein